MGRLLEAIAVLDRAGGPRVRRFCLSRRPHARAVAVSASRWSWMPNKGARTLTVRPVSDRVGRRSGAVRRRPAVGHRLAVGQRGDACRPAAAGDRHAGHAPCRRHSNNALPAAVSTRPLDADAARRVGLISAEDAGLPADLWGALAGGGHLAQRLMRRTARDAARACRRCSSAILLAELDPPVDAAATDTSLFLARIDRLLELGAARRGGGASGPRAAERPRDLPPDASTWRC